MAKILTSLTLPFTGITASDRENETSHAFQGVLNHRLWPGIKKFVACKYDQVEILGSDKDRSRKGVVRA